MRVGERCKTGMLECHLKKFDKNAAGENRLRTNLDYNCAGRLVGCFSFPVRDQGYWMKDPVWLVQKLFGKRGSSNDYGKGKEPWHLCRAVSGVTSLENLVLEE